MIESLIIKLRNLTIAFIILTFVILFFGKFLNKQITPSIQSTIQDNIIFATKNLITSCKALQSEIKIDEKYRWPLNCTMSHKEQVAYQKRKQEY